MDKEKGLEIKLHVIKYDFTTVELAALSADLAEQIAERDGLAKKKKDFDSKIGFEIKTAELEIVRMAKEHRDGYKHCSHPCYEVFDFDTKQVFIHREDTDIRVDVRTMEIDEYQRDIFNPTETIKEGGEILNKLNESQRIFDEFKKNMDGEFLDLPESVQTAVRYKCLYPTQFTQACKELKFNPNAVEKFVDASAIPVCERVKEILEAEDGPVVDVEGDYEKLAEEKKTDE